MEMNMEPAEPRKRKSTALPEVPVANLPEAALQLSADRVRHSYGRSVAATIATGQTLIKEKAATKQHGDWGRLFKKHPRAVTHPIPFSQNMAERLMGIAENPILSKSAHWAELPSSWRTLSELTQLPHETLEQFIRSGVVSPELTRNTAEALVYGSKRYVNFTTEHARAVVTYRKRLDRRDAVQSYPCQCQCGHKHTDQRLKSRPKLPDLSPKPEGKGEATT